VTGDAQRSAEKLAAESLPQGTISGNAPRTETEVNRLVNGYAHSPFPFHTATIE